MHSFIRRQGATFCSGPTFLMPRVLTDTDRQRPRKWTCNLTKTLKFFSTIASSDKKVGMVDRIMAPKNVHIEPLETVGMLLYMAKDFAGVIK